MSGTVAEKLASLGIELPAETPPAANYLPFVISGDLIFVSGQISADRAGLITGKLGDGMGVEAGYAAARTCAIALLARLNVATGGDLDRIVRVVKLGGFVNATPDFTDHHKVINGASDLLAEVFGDRGKHARAAVGCVSLPLGAATEVEGIFQLG